MSTHRYELRDNEWERIKDMLPPEHPKKGKRGRQAKYDNRSTLNGILWIARSGAPWRELPERYGKWRAIYARKLRLHQDFGASRSQTIIQHLTSVMEELTTPNDLEQDLTSDFQLLLTDSVYPFLACSQVMQDAGMDIRIVNRYVKKKIQ